MSPPKYADVGKDAKDIFSKGFNYGFLKFEGKTKTKEPKVEFKTNLNSNTDSGKVVGSLETKYKCSDYGITLTEKWSTDNVLNTEVKIEDQLAKGLDLSFNTSFAPNTGKKSGSVKSEFKHDYIRLNCDVDFDFAGPTVHGAAVLGYEGFLAGYQMSFDSSKSKLTKSNFAFGYEGKDFTLTTNVNNLQEFTGSVHHKVAKGLEAAVALGVQADSGNTTFAVGGKYKLDGDSSVSMKVNNSSHLGCGFSHQLRDGIKLNLSSLIDCKNINAGGNNKFGIGLEFEA